ncbi:hypothetical protein CBR_g39526 [Chara braunii]|uniref:Uncharacterized protein n=1 Tax=Chara braunii TaxID=69332 RepID=A0A388LS81_CHABU|nr:hypothetical protein CBR_g39526 [Chara braunii]|eukprot:GBG85063.1 hypothetical protein CBR_g39526 [Chara braunii]
MTNDARTGVAPAMETMSTRIGAHFPGLERGLVGEIHHRDTSFDMVDDVWIREDDGQDEVDVINYFALLSAVYVDGGSGVDEQAEEDVFNFDTDEDSDTPFYTDDDVGQGEADGQDEGDVAKYYAHLTAVYEDGGSGEDEQVGEDVVNFDSDDDGDMPFLTHDDDCQREVDGQNEGDVAKHSAHLTAVYKDGGLQDDEGFVLQGDGDQPEVGEEEQGSMVEAGVNLDKEQRMEEWEVAQGIMAEAVAAVEDRQVMGETGDNGGRADNTNDKKNHNTVITAGVVAVVDERQGGVSYVFQTLSSPHNIE